MIAPSTCAFSVSHGTSSVLVTVTKSPPRNTRATPSRPNNAVASGERAAEALEAKSAVERPITSRPGRNFNVAGFGVPSVSMNMVFEPCNMNGKRARGNRTAAVREPHALHRPGRGAWQEGFRGHVAIDREVYLGVTLEAPRANQQGFTTKAAKATGGHEAGKIGASRGIGTNAHAKRPKIFLRVLRWPSRPSC